MEAFELLKAGGMFAVVYLLIELIKYIIAKYTKNGAKNDYALQLALINQKLDNHVSHISRDMAEVKEDIKDIKREIVDIKIAIKK